MRTSLARWCGAHLAAILSSCADRRRHSRAADPPSTASSDTGPQGRGRGGDHVSGAIVRFTADRRGCSRIRRHDDMWLFVLIRSDAVLGDR